MTNYYWYSGEDAEYSDRPVDAREFRRQHRHGVRNPNIPVEDQERDW